MSISFRKMAQAPSCPTCGRCRRAAGSGEEGAPSLRAGARRRARQRRPLFARPRSPPPPLRDVGLVAGSRLTFAFKCKPAQRRGTACCLQRCDRTITERGEPRVAAEDQQTDRYGTMSSGTTSSGARIDHTSNQLSLGDAGGMTGWATRGCRRQVRQRRWHKPGACARLPAAARSGRAWKPADAGALDGGNRREATAPPLRPTGHPVGIAQRSLRPWPGGNRRSPPGRLGGAPGAAWSPHQLRPLLPAQRLP